MAATYSFLYMVRDMDNNIWHILRYNDKLHIFVIVNCKLEIITTMNI